MKFQVQPVYKSYPPIAFPEASVNRIDVGRRSKSFDIFVPATAFFIMCVHKCNTNLQSSSNEAVPLTLEYRAAHSGFMKAIDPGMMMEVQTSFPINCSKTFSLH